MPLPYLFSISPRFFGNLIFLLALTILFYPATAPGKEKCDGDELGVLNIYVFAAAFNEPDSVKEPELKCVRLKRENKQWFTTKVWMDNGFGDKLRENSASGLATLLESNPEELEKDPDVTKVAAIASICRTIAFDYLYKIDIPISIVKKHVKAPLKQWLEDVLKVVAEMHIGKGTSDNMRRLRRSFMRITTPPGELTDSALLDNALRYCSAKLQVVRADAPNTPLLLPPRRQLQRPSKPQLRMNLLESPLPLASGDAASLIVYLYAAAFDKNDAVTFWILNRVRRMKNKWFTADVWSFGGFGDELMNNSANFLAMLLKNHKGELIGKDPDVTMVASTGLLCNSIISENSEWIQLTIPFVKASATSRNLKQWFEDVLAVVPKMDAGEKMSSTMEDLRKRFMEITTEPGKLTSNPLLEWAFMYCSDILLQKSKTGETVLPPLWITGFNLWRSQR